MGESPFSVITGGVVSPESACGASGSCPPELPPHAVINNTAKTSQGLRRGCDDLNKHFISKAWRIDRAISTYLREGGFVT